MIHRASESGTKSIQLRRAPDLRNRRLMFSLALEIALEIAVWILGWTSLGEAANLNAMRPLYACRFTRSAELNPARCTFTSIPRSMYPRVQYIEAAILCIAMFICYFPLAAKACAKSIYIKSIRRARRGRHLGVSQERSSKMPTGRCRVRGEYGKNGARRERERILFRTAKLNYQIKQQRRYINKIDFPRRSSKGHASAPSFRRLTSFRATPRFNHVARRLKRSLFIFVINPTSCARARVRAAAGGGMRRESYYVK